jgi:hypothetical protein
MYAGFYGVYKNREAFQIQAVNMEEDVFKQLAVDIPSQTTSDKVQLGSGLCLGLGLGLGLGHHPCCVLSSHALLPSL